MTTPDNRKLRNSSLDPDEDAHAGYYQSKLNRRQDGLFREAMIEALVSTDMKLPRPRNPGIDRAVPQTYRALTHVFTASPINNL